MMCEETSVLGGYFNFRENLKVGSLWAVFLLHKFNFGDIMVAVLKKGE